MKTYVQSSIKISLLIFSILFSPAIGRAQWTTKVKLSNHAMKAQLNENMGQCLVANGDTLHIVWSDKRTNGSSIWYKRSIDTGLSWNTEVPITDTNGTAAFPAIAVSGSIVHVVWRDSSLGHYASFYKRSTDGGNTWSTPYCLDSNTLFWPGVAASGSMVVVSLNKGIFGSTYVAFRRSLDNGATWDTVRTISTRTGPGRSEDPAIATDGNFVHLSWNDNRSGIMEIYYRRSADKGVTWDPEVRLVHNSVNDYTTMVCLNDSNVDVPCGDRRSGVYDVYMGQSHNYGLVFDTIRQVTATPATEAYPYLVRYGMDLHMVYLHVNAGGGPFYIHSTDGGVTWSTPDSIGTGGQPFIAITCPVLHIIWPDSGNIYYTRNPTGNATCITHSTIVNNTPTQGSELTVYPNPSSNIITIRSLNELGQLTIYNSLGEIVYRKNTNTIEEQIDISQLPVGMYILFARNKHVKFIKE